MKHLFTALLVLSSLQVWSIKASVDFLRYSNLDNQYIEINYRVFVNSLVEEDEQMPVDSKVLSTIIIYQEEEIVDFQKNMLIGGSDQKDLLDVRRFLLSPGDYRIVVELENQMGSQKVLKIEKRITIENDEPITLSDIMLLATAKQSSEPSPMVRNGIYLEALPYAYYGDDKSVLNSYVEVYGLQDTEKYYCSYEIVKGYDTEAQEVQVVKYKRLSSEDLQAHLLNLDISNLVSGDYHFAVSVFNPNKELVAVKKVNFYRSNTNADINQLSLRSDKFSSSFANNISEDSLNYYLMAIAPVVYEPKRTLLNTLLSKDNVLAKRRFIHDYWKERSGDSAEGACIAYMNIARAVDKRFFNGTSYGFDTDLGYIFLRYGKPDNAMIVDDELSAFPYQIWRYDKILATGENNVKFLFYAPTLSHRDFRLLHSTCRLELQNPSWEAELYRRLPDEIVGNASEVRSVNDGMSRRAKDLWNDF